MHKHLPILFLDKKKSTEDMSRKYAIVIMQIKLKYAQVTLVLQGFNESNKMEQNNCHMSLPR